MFVVVCVPLRRQCWLLFGFPYSVVLVVVCVLPRASVWVEEDERKEAIFILYNCITTLNTIAGI